MLLLLFKQNTSAGTTGAPGFRSITDAATRTSSAADAKIPPSQAVAPISEAAGAISAVSSLETWPKVENVGLTAAEDMSEKRP